MSDKELLNDWLIKLYASLKETNDEIEVLENKMDYRTKLNEVHLDRLSTWLTYKDLNSDVKEELEYSKLAVERMIKEFKDKLDRLKKSKKATLFMIEQVEKELRG